MKNLLKGAAITVIVLVVSMVIQIFCNVKGIQIDLTIAGPTTAVCAMLVYHGLTKNEKNKDNQE